MDFVAPAVHVRLFALSVSLQASFTAGITGLGDIGSLGLMLFAGEVPRIAGAFGLDTSTKASLTSAVHTAQMVVSTTKVIRWWVNSSEERIKTMDHTKETGRIDTAPPSLYAILTEGTPGGPLAGQSGYLAEDGRRLYFHEGEAAERKIRDLQNRCMNGSPAAVYKCVTYPCMGMPDNSITAEAIGSYDLRPGFDPAEAELRSQVYGNTGGGCMVGTASYYLPSLDRTVWVNCNDEGATITSADYVWNDDLSESWARYEDVRLFSVQFNDTPPEELGLWQSMILDTLTYTASQQAAQGRAFRLPGPWQDALEEQGQPPGPVMDAPY